MSPDLELLVVGAGPAGLAAASEATRAGVRTLVVDSASTTGGQYYARASRASWDEGLPENVVGGARSELLELRLGTCVWGVFGDQVVVAAGERSETIRPAAIVLATGAVERPVPFPGWDRPGVTTPGALQRLLKISRAVPNGSVVLVGSGPFLIAVAADLRRAGADVRAVIESRTRRQLLELMPALARRPERLRDAVGFGRTLRGVELRFGVDLVAVDDTGLALSDGTRIAADVIGAGYGFAPRLDLARLLGLAVEPHGVVVDGDLATSRAGVFAAGEASGIGGAPLAAAEGRLAGLAAARYLGRPTDDARHRELAAARGGHARFAQSLAHAYPPAPILGAATAQTTICRCEHVPLSALSHTFASGQPPADPRAAKARLRCGMGPCQGMLCGEAVRAATGFDASEGDRRVPRVRPPLMPVTVGAVASGELAQPEPTTESARL